jgi:uncharacterized repeat protein (TIGR03847 family)
VFYLQAGDPGQLVSLKLEKAQVLFLAGGLSEVLADLAAPGEGPGDAELELEPPAEADWAVGSIQLAYDPGRDRVVMVARELPGDEEAEGTGGEEAAPGIGPRLEELFSGPQPDGPGVARLVITRAQAAGLVRRGRELLNAGRPPCPLCGYPLGEDHSCPKTNGHRAPAL